MRLFLAIFLFVPFLICGESEDEALFLRRIADFWQEGEYQIAKTQIEEFIVQYPQSPFSDALCAALGDLFLREKNFSNALNYYSKVQSPEFFQKVFLNRMQCLYEMQWYATLADECEAYLAKNPNTQVTYFLSIALYHQCINASKETEQCLVLARKAKSYFEALYESEFSQEIAQGYAHLCCILKDYAKATELYSALAQKDPSLEEEMLFQVALIQSEYDKALAFETFDKIAKLNQKKAKEAAYNQMVIAFELGQYKEITDTDFLNKVPKDRLETARLFLGRSLFQLKRFDDAIVELKAYIEDSCSRDNLLPALLSLLDASYQNGDLESLDLAIEKLATTYPQNPELPKAYFSRSQVLKRHGMLAEAKLELEKLLNTYPTFSQKAQAVFELTHLDYKSKDWENCYRKGFEFLSEFSQHELAPFVWRYFISSSSEIAILKPEHTPTFLKDLELFLELPLSESEKNEWQLLLAKTLFQMGQYESAMSSLKDLDTANAKLLFSLCYRDGYKDIEKFCELGEQALKEGANLVDLGQIHASLYNGFLELSNLDKAAHHLYEAFMAKAELKVDNLLWLAEYYYNILLEDEGNFLMAARSSSLFERCKQMLEELSAIDSVTCKLAKIYSILGKVDHSIEILEQLENPSSDAKLLLAENYAKKGLLDRAVEIFDAIVANTGNVRSPTAAAASFQGAKIKLTQENANLSEIATELKNLVIQKNFEGEPIYLESALEYITIVSKNDLQKKRSLLLKTKHDFEQQEDLLSKDYHAGREKYPRKNITYTGYMDLIDAEIMLIDAKIDPQNQKDKLAKSKNLLLQIMEQPIASSLKERVQKLLADET